MNDSARWLRSRSGQVAGAEALFGQCYRQLVECSQVTVVCAWCNAIVSPGGEQISHGICTACAKDFMARLPRSFLESVAEPDGTVTLFTGRKLGLDTIPLPETV